MLADTKKIQPRPISKFDALQKLGYRIGIAEL
jgi:hypothetical protein